MERRAYRLSSLLIEFNLLSIEGIKHALIRQAVNGGALDTALFEEGWRSEGVILDLLSRSTGYLPICSELFSSIDRSVAVQIDAKLAAALRICPLYYSSEGIVTLVQEDTDARALADLAARINEPLVLFVATELRVVQTRRDVYGITDLEARFERLLERFGAEIPAPVQAASADPLVFGQLPMIPTEMTIIQPPRWGSVRMTASGAAIPVVADKASDHVRFNGARIAGIQPLDLNEAVVRVDETQTPDEALLVLTRGLASLASRVQLLSVQGRSLAQHTLYHQGTFSSVNDNKELGVIGESPSISRAEVAGPIVVTAIDDDPILTTLLAADNRSGRTCVVLPIRVLHKLVAVVILEGNVAAARNILDRNVLDNVDQLTLATGRVLLRLLAEKKRAAPILVFPVPQSEESAQTARTH